jgi:hypothetical protein
MAVTRVPLDYFLFEARRAPRRAAVATAIGGVLVVLGTHALLVRFPPALFRFMEQAFRIEGLAAILLINDLLAAYFVTFFLGLGGLLDATVTSREEGGLEILLAKPIRGRVLLTARATPVLVAAAVAGSIVAFVVGLTVPRYLAPHDAITPGGALGSSLGIVALGLFLLSVLLPLFVILRDRLYALLLAAMVWIGPVLPTGFFIYRPDLFDAHPGSASSIVLASLLWHDGVAAWLGPLALAASLPFGAIMVMLAGRILERSDAR